MTPKIEIYIKTEKKLAGQYFSPPVSDGVMIHTCLSKKMLEYEKTLPQAEKQILEFMNNYCERKELPIEIIDLSTLKGNLKAKMKGITKTPTIAIDQEQIEAPANLDTLEQELEAHLKQSGA